MQFLAFNVNCCIHYIDWNSWDKFSILYLDQNDVINALREIRMPSKMTDKERLSEAEVLSVRPDLFQSLAGWKRIGLYLNASQIRLMLLLLLML